MKKISFLAEDKIELDGLLYLNNLNSSNEKNIKNEDIKEIRKNTKIIISIHGMSSNCFKNREEVIAKNLEEYDYFCFNNRGSELVKYIRKTENSKKIKSLGGATYEDPLDSYYDILGAIKYVLSIGYTDILLQGHSLGSTKIVYTYNRLKNENNLVINNIKGIILLSLVDIVAAIKVFSKDKYKENINLALELSKNDNLALMPHNSFIHPISAKTYLNYTINSKDIDFAGFGRDEELNVLNNIDVPIFMRWGNINEMIIQKAEDLVLLVNTIIKNENKDIGYIDGADHGYSKKEDILAKEISNFIKNI